MTVSIRPFREDDRDVVLELAGLAFGPIVKELLAIRWQWQFHDNPAADEAPALVFLAEKDDRVIGFSMHFPARLKVQDREIHHYFGGGFMVMHAEQRRGVGEALIDRYYQERVGPIRLILGYSDATARIVSRMGRCPVDALPVLLRPLPTKVAATFLMANMNLTPVLARRPLSWLTRRVLMGWSLIMNRRRKPEASSTYTVARATTVGEEFDELWNDTKGHFPLVGVRDRRFIQWRFVDDPAFEHRILVVRDEKGKLTGYIAVRVTMRQGHAVGWIMDLFCAPRNEDLCQALVCAGIAHLEEENINYILCIGLHPALRRSVEWFLYVRPSRLQRPALISWEGPEHAIKQAFLDSDNWHLSYADSDLAYGS